MNFSEVEVEYYSACEKEILLPTSTWMKRGDVILGEISQTWKDKYCVIPFLWDVWKLSESCLVMANSLWPHGLYSPWSSPGQNTGVGGPSLLQGIFPIQGLNWGLPHCTQTLYHLSHQGSNTNIKAKWLKESRGIDAGQGTTVLGIAPWT